MDNADTEGVLTALVAKRWAFSCHACGPHSTTQLVPFTRPKNDSVFLRLPTRPVRLTTTGAMTDMPAVRVFALYAGVAIVINFFLQIFAFTALLTIDAKRTAVS